MNFFKKFTIKIDKVRLFKNNGHVFLSCTCKILKYYKMCENEKFQRNLSTNISKTIKYLFVFKNILES